MTSNIFFSINICLLGYYLEKFICKKNKDTKSVIFGYTDKLTLSPEIPVKGGIIRSES